MTHAEQLINYTNRLHALLEGYQPSSEAERQAAEEWRNVQRRDEWLHRYYAEEAQAMRQREDAARTVA